MENDALPQYMRIARSIAQRIADGELQEGEKLSGRSKLSSEYNVSPETIRKAVQVLQDRAVVNVREQSGVYVLSAAQAAQSLPNYCVRIPEDWDGAGKSLGALKFWRATGATVVAIRRSGQEIVSPGPDTALLCGDLLIFVGDLEARKGVVRFFSSNP